MQIAVIGDVIVARCLRHDMMPQAITDQHDIERIRRLAEDFNAACALRPFSNRIQLSLMLGARAFALEVADIRGHLRRYAEKRQQLMAFTFVVGHGELGLKPIGRVFNRNHATVKHAVLKYETAMKELVL